MAENDNLRLAVLIDADNAQAAVFPELLAEVAKYGTAHTKRAYGNWTTTNLQSWKNLLHKHAIQPIQQFSYTTGKNATDAALIIDAMDLLHANVLDGFCLVSSDSDFTRLATRIRESGLKVYGFGEKAKTPEPFISSCDKFIFTENLKPKARKKIATPEATALKKALQGAIKAISKDDGWASLPEIGSYINKHDPAFDHRNFGFAKLSELVKAQNYLKVETRKPKDSASGGTIFVTTK